MRIGVDLGGTKIEAIALDDDGTIRARSRVASTPGDYAATLAAISDLVRDVESSIGGHASVGIGMPGTLSPVTGLVRNANSTWLNGKPFADDLERTLDRPVRIANDADCFTLSEAVDGAAAGARRHRDRRHDLERSQPHSRRMGSQRTAAHRRRGPPAAAMLVRAGGLYRVLCVRPGAGRGPSTARP